jgi:hypothetical protein
MAVLAARTMMEVHDAKKNIHPFFEKRTSKFKELLWPLTESCAVKVC